MNFTQRIDDELSLSLVQPSLAEEIYALVDRNREYLMPWMPWVKSTESAEQIHSWIKDSLNSFAEGKSMACAICLDNTIVGIIGYNEIDQSLGKAKIGYWVSSEHQSRGIVTRACQHLIDHAFGELKLQKIEIAAAKENERSRAICERLGMTLEGIITNSERVEDNIYDHAVYGLSPQRTKNGKINPA
nr:GNAT family protein [Candidatus Krumholzibacteria bacterium]